MRGRRGAYACATNMLVTVCGAVAQTKCMHHSESKRKTWNFALRGASIKASPPYRRHGVLAQSSVEER
eukprot:1832664-Pleurochrysis_carterae.AAC.1